MKKLVLIDGHSILFRAFYGMPLTMTAPDGTHTNAVYGFLAILNKVIEEEQPDYLACAFDLAAPTFRHEMYPEYKGNRAAAPAEFHEQVPLIQSILTDMEIPVLTQAGWEADDILGTLARQAEAQGIRVSLISGDRDLLQIASEGCEIVIPKTKGGTTTYERYSPETVKETYGVTPKEFIELKALMGDSSDNVPGLPGVGPKTAQKILAQFGSIENASAHVDEIKPKKAMEGMRDHYDLLMLSRDLVTIRTNAPVSFTEKEFALSDIYNEKTYEDFRRLGFKSFLSRFQNQPAKEEEPALPVAEQITDLGEAESVFAKSITADVLGLSVVTEGNEFYAAGLSFGKKSYVFVPGGFLTEDYLKSKLAEILLKAGRIAVMDAKQLLKAVPSEDRGAIFDAAIAAYLLDPLKSDWEVSSVASGYLSMSIPSREELLGKKGIMALQEEKREALIAQLASCEAVVAMRAMPFLLAKLDESSMRKLFDEVEMPLTYVLAGMELEGILASRTALMDYSNSLSERLEELKTAIYTEAGEEFNINSPKQLGTILFEKMGLTGGKKTKTGYSTAADVLEKLAGEYPIVAHILEYRTYSKLKSTYADGLPAFIQADDKIHTIFHQTVTATGRLSSSDPNLQNIPMRTELGRRIRKCFVPHEGHVFVDADYSQIELRVLAHMSGDPQLVEAYREAKDIHRMTASQVFHVPFEEVTDLQRRQAKAVNFGIVYGQSAFGLSEGLSISRKEAQEFINQYFRTFPSIKSFLDGLVEEAKQTGYAVSIFGRRRPIPELKSSNFMQRSFGERVAMNSPIQGTAADIMKIAMIRVAKRLKREGLKSKLILQIHDELLIEAPLEEADYIQTLLSEEMKQAASLRVALETDCHIGSDWYEAK